MGRVLAVDPGTVRVGLAISDPLRITAQPLDVIPAQGAVQHIAGLCRDMEVEEVVVGLPVTEKGEEGEPARSARLLGDEIAAATGLPVTAVDERYTSRLAETAMIDGGVRRRQRRGSVDKVAAAMILRSFLDRRSR
jgi:putative Holliday junction resolvase